MHLFCMHHAGGTTASFAGWQFPGVKVTKLGYRGRDFRSVPDAADAMLRQIESASASKVALYGHSMGAILAFEVALRMQASGRVEHVFLAAARVPRLVTGENEGAPAMASAAASVLSGALSERARAVLHEDLSLLAKYEGRAASGQLTVPTTVLFSGDDEVVSPEESLSWASWCATSPRRVEVAGGGHLFHRNNPQVRLVVEQTLCSVAQ